MPKQTVLRNRVTLSFQWPFQLRSARMNRSAIAVVNEKREFTFTDIANKAFWIRVETSAGFQNGRTIPTRGISVTIQPNTTLRRSSAATGATSEPGNIFTACRIRNMQTAQFEIQRE